MADTSQLVTIILAIFLFGIVFPAIAYGLVRRFHYRHHVWMEIDSAKRTYALLVKPEDDRHLVWGKGRYDMTPGDFTLFNGGWFNGGVKPLYRYMHGKKFPIVFRTRKFVAKSDVEMVSTNPGEVISYKAGEIVEIPMARHASVPAETQEVFWKQKLFSDAYHGSQTLLVLVIVGIVLLVLLVVGLYARR